MKFALAALIAVASTQALADARSIETADCSVKLNGNTGMPTSFSLETMASPKILAEGGGFVLQARPISATPVVRSHTEDTVNPIVLEIITVNGTMSGSTTYNYGEGSTSIQAMAPLGNGQLVPVEATCTVTYVE